MTQITCRDLTIGYGSRIILKHLNFTVNEGDYLCIIGENGSGKSSLSAQFSTFRIPTAVRFYMTIRFSKTVSVICLSRRLVKKIFLHPFVKSSFPDVTDAAAFILFIMLLIKRKAVTAMQQLKITHLAHRCYRELSGRPAAACTAGSGIMCHEKNSFS